MTRIQTKQPEEADGALSEIYNEINKERGGVAEIHRALSLRPDLMKAHFDFYRSVMLSEQSSLSKKERELLAVTVSLYNGSGYCAAHHGKALEACGGDPLRLSYHRPISSGQGIDLREQAIVEFSRKLAIKPTTTDDKDIEKLRMVGFSDKEILEIILIISYFCCANRFVLALDVGLEKDYEKTCK